MSSRRVSAGSGTNGHAAVVALRRGSLMSGVGSDETDDDCIAFGGTTLGFSVACSAKAAALQI